MRDLAINIFDRPAILRAVQRAETIDVSVILENGDAFHRVFTFWKADQILKSNEQPALELMMPLYRPRGVIRFLTMLSNIAIGLYRLVVSLFQLIFGSFIGVGAFGILLVLCLAIVLLAFSLYAFLIALPFFAIAFFVHRHNDRKVADELIRLQKKTFDFCLETLSISEK